MPVLLHSSRSQCAKGNRLSEVNEEGQNNEQINKGPSGVVTFEEIAPFLERLFSSEERKELDRRFLLYSSDGIMSNRHIC